MNPDIVNSGFLLTAGFFILFSVVKLYKEKEVRGVSLIHAGFFSVYGFWHICFFSLLEQWWSIIGGVFSTTINTVWVILLIYYTVYPKGKT